MARQCVALCVCVHVGTLFSGNERQLEVPKTDRRTGFVRDTRTSPDTSISRAMTRTTNVTFGLLSRTRWDARWHPSSFDAETETLRDAPRSREY